MSQVTIVLGMVSYNLQKCFWLRMMGTEEFWNSNKYHIQKSEGELAGQRITDDNDLIVITSAFVPLHFQIIIRRLFPPGPSRYTRVWTLSHVTAEALPATEQHPWLLNLIPVVKHDSLWATTGSVGGCVHVNWYILLLSHIMLWNCARSLSNRRILMRCNVWLLVLEGAGEKAN